MRKIVPEKHAQQRAALIAAARQQFSKFGFAGTSTAMIQAKAGISTGKLFHYFPTKQALILAVIEDQNQQVHGWNLALVAESEPLLALDLLIDGIWKTATDPQESNLILEITAEAGRNVDVNKLISEADRQLTITINTLIAKAINNGMINPAIKSDQITYIIMAWIDGIFSRAVSDPNFLSCASLSAFQVGLRAILGQHKS